MAKPKRRVAYFRPDFNVPFASEPTDKRVACAEVVSSCQGGVRVVLSGHTCFVPDAMLILVDEGEVN